VIVTGEAGSLFEAMTKLLRYGSHCRVLEPPELVEAMREEVTRMAEQYRMPSNSKQVQLRLARPLQ